MEQMAMITVNRNVLVAATLTTWIFILQPLLAQPTASTNSISLQARLSGVPDGTVNLSVRFFDALSGGAQVGTTITLGSVSVQGGIVSVPVSPVEAFIFNGNTRYMEISVNGGTPLIPRTLVTAVPYAMRSLDTRGLRVDDDGHVGIKTTRPMYGSLNIAADSGQAAVEISNSNPDVDPMKLIMDGWHDPSGAIRFALLVPFAHPGGHHGGTSAQVMYWDGEQLSFGSPEGGAPVFNVGIGTRTPQARLDVAGTARVQVLQITGGSDVAEPIAITPTHGVTKARPGMVMVIDRQHDGKLVPCSTAYDKAVAGVLSGANGLKPGMVLSAEGQLHTSGGDDTLPLAMTGRVWVLCDATTTQIRRGDSLTTSATEGHAMAVTDELKRPGAVIGKAMTELCTGRGLVLTLVNLQ
ncbi:MAG: hypothetical protein H7210_08870 [Pyrinomonadaceae bacterium]|nr:hypothetical protein [Phycisphaerales bacterium]